MGESNTGEVDLVFRIDGEVVRVADPKVAEWLRVEGAEPLEPAPVAAVARSGEAIIDWPGTVEDLADVANIRRAAASVPAGVLCVRTGHVGVVKELEAVSDRELITAIVQARGSGADVD